MSASDAAPLPRLGEVFFDVRGSSRSMRLSWYADTGIAVFSIWQGGMCTGTFRLPIGDLPRMIEILQRGPEDQEPPRPPQQRGGRREPGRSAQREFRTGAVLRPDRDDGDDRHEDASTAAYGVQDDTQGPAHRDARPRRARGDQGHDERGGARPSRHGRDDPAHGYWSQPEPEATTGPWPGSGRAGGDQSWSGPGHDDEGDRSWSEYEQAGYADDHGSGYDRDELSGGSRRGYGHGRTGQTESAGHRREDEQEPATGGYEPQRFVPPYVAGGPGEYGNDIFQGSSDPLGDPRESAYRDDLGYGRSQPDEYDRDSWPGDGYSDGPSYRLAVRPDGPSADKAGRHSAGTERGLPHHDRPHLGYASQHDEAGEIDTQPGDYRVRPRR
jgi:hypothetical protein